MRARNALTRLAAVAPHAETVLDAGEEARILARILAAPRQARRRRPLVVALAGVAVVGGAAIAASLGLGNAQRSLTQGPGQRHVALTGARIQMAGYHFRTPAGYKSSDGSCVAASPGSGPVSVTNGFAAAASADGGCIEAFLVASHSGPPSDHGAEPVAVGSYRGYFVPPDSSGQSTLYVALPEASAAYQQYVALFATGLTEEQLVAIAVSGLPTLPIVPSTTTGTETTG